MVNTSNIEKAIKAAASDPKQKKLSFFINAVAPVGHAANKSSRKSPDGSPAHTGVPPSTPPPAPTPASLPPTAHPTTSAPTTPDSQKIQPMVAPSAPVKPVSKAPTKLQRKKARIRACLKCDPCPCPSNICSSEAGTHIPARDQKEVAYTPFGTFLRRICGLPAIQPTCGLNEQKRLWVCKYCYDHARYQWSLLKLLKPIAKPIAEEGLQPFFFCARVGGGGSRGRYAIRF
jgi:hypothetical protein